LQHGFGGHGFGQGVGQGFGAQGLGHGAWQGAGLTTGSGAGLGQGLGQGAGQGVGQSAIGAGPVETSPSSATALIIQKPTAKTDIILRNILYLTKTFL
jgi:hypothetical protein